jgi:hypothetical protein
MSISNVTPFCKPVNRQEQKLIARVRRMCAHHHLKLYRCRDKKFRLDDPGFQLRSFAVVAGADCGLSLSDVLAIIKALEPNK